MNICSWCSHEFEAKVKYQIYCSVECRDQATKEKILKRYQTNKIKNRSSKIRKCAGGCGSNLSIYNDDNLCSTCTVNQRKVDKMIKELKGLFEYEQDI